MEAPSKSTILVAAGTILVGISAYAVYFDYKRRNDPDFRRNLRREQKRLSTQQREKAREAEMGATESLKQAHRRALEEPLPTSPEDREQAFMTEVARGETLYAAGQSAKYDSAICFYRALKMYPQPAELTRIYEQTIPGFVFEIVLEMVKIDEEERLEAMNERVE